VEKSGEVIMRTQREIILKVVSQSAEPVPSWNLQKVDTFWGWLGTSGDRVARLMAENGELERVRKGKYVYYSVPQPSKQQRLL